MPRACPVESHGGRYQRAGQDRKRCHGLVPWSLTVAATNEQAKIVSDATGLSRGVSRWPLPTSMPRSSAVPRACPVQSHGGRYQRAGQDRKRCHGLAPWSLTVAATNEQAKIVSDATGLSRGVSR